MNKAKKIYVDFNEVIAQIKPMHAINNMPCLPYNRKNMYECIKEANIPYSRLHDTGGAFGGSRYVDINNIFPDFDADETDASSYDFAFTDVLLQEMVKYDVKPFYRLGTTIENFQKIKAYNIYPPKDYHKWAKICEMIIRHYNEGWADGFYMGIEHWEIWNEPDNFPDDENQMWKGTKEEYFELYKVASLHLKKRFPNLKIGGYASCGFYAINGTDVSSDAKTSNRFGYFVDFFIDFLEYVRENKLPFDFFSWHSYASVADNIVYAEYAREKLDSYGFKDCEMYLNEWNYRIDERGTQKNASDTLAMMCALQNSSVDMCMYYQASIVSAYCGIFNPINYDVFNAYYAFYYFGKLYKMKHQVLCNAEGDNIYSIAAADEQNKGIIIVNNSSEAVSVDINICGNDDKKSIKIYATDDRHRCDVLSVNGSLIDFPAYGIRYIEL